MFVSCSNFSDIRQLLIYPPGKGGLSINTEDYMCLAQDQFLNDVIIDFYLKYLVIHLPADKQNKVHVFSTFFYNRLTTKPSRLNRYVIYCKFLEISFVLVHMHFILKYNKRKIHSYRICLRAIIAISFYEIALRYF